MSNPKPDDVIRIAGAGPSGLAAAIRLARAGRKVEVHEQRPVVGGRWKKGLQIIENFSEKDDVLAMIRELGLEINFDTTPIHRVTLRDGHKEAAEFNSRAPLGYYVRRGPYMGCLDAGLRAQAEKAGARIVFNSRIEPAKARLACTGPRRVDGLGKEMTFATPLSDRMTVILDPELAPGGYAYLFILGGEATLGIAVLGAYREVDTLFQKVSERFQAIEGLTVPAGEEAYLYANFFLKPTLETSGRAYAGEAGGFQDYLFGFGIRYAIESGNLAARSILEPNSSYDALWKERLGKKQKISLFNRFFYEKFPRWLPAYIVRGAQKSGDLREYLRIWYQPMTVKLWTAEAIGKFWNNKRTRLTLDPKAFVKEYENEESRRLIHR